MILLIKLILIPLRVCSLSSSDLFVFYSELTPESIHSEFRGFENKMQIDLNDDELEIMEKVKFKDFSLILDLTISQAYFFIIDTICQNYNLPYITITPSDSVTYSKLRFHLGNSYLHESNAISTFVNFFNLKNLAILVSNNHEFIKIVETLKDLLPFKEITICVYTQDISQEKSDNTIQKMIKVKGLRNFLILDNGDLLGKIQTSIKTLKLEGKGSLFIFFTKTPRNVILEGSLILCQKDTESSVSDSNFYLVSVLKTINKIDMLSYSEINPEYVLKILESNYKNHMIFSDYSITNVQNSAYKLIGSINNTVDIYDEIIYPGGVTDYKNHDSVAIVTVSIANGTSEAYNLNTYFGFSYLYEAARYAVFRSNALNEFPNFRFELFKTDCGIFLYDPTWYKACFSQITNNLGIAYMTSLWKDSALGNMLSLRELGLNIPQISALTLDENLDNNTKYPEFFKLIPPPDDTLGSAILFLRSFNWHHFVFFVSDDYTDMYYSILDIAEENEFYFDNPASMRILPMNYTRNDFAKYRSYFEAAKNSNCRIFVLATSSSNQYLIEALYDIGLRKGDVLILGTGELYRFLIGEKDENNLKKYRELLPGSFMNGYLEWSGNLGEMLKNELKQFFTEISYMCLVYDSFSVIKNTFNFMLTKGLDYEDPELFIKSLRNTFGIGCLGKLSFNKQSTSKSSTKYLYQQILLNETNNNFYLNDVIVVDKFSANAITGIGEIDWINFDNVIPTNYRPEPKCLFDEYLIKKVHKSRIIFYIFSSVFALITGISGFFSSRKCKSEIVEITKKTPISLSDYIFMSYFFLQFFQYITLGPSQTTYKYIFNNFEILLSLDLSSYITFNTQFIWLILIVVLSLIYFWVLLCLIIVTFSFNEIFAENALVKKITIIGDLLLPFIGNIGFIPVISMLFNIYQCNRGIGESLTESLFDLDCSKSCYEGSHLKMMVTTTIGLSIFIYLGVYYRSEWERRQTMLNIRTKPIYLAIMSFIQLLMIIISKSLKNEHSMANGIVNSALLIVLIVATVLIKPYNYTKVYIMQLTSLALSFWAIFTAAIIGENFDFTVWIATEFGGLLLILLIGMIIINKYPKLLYSDEVNKIPQLFLFQFNFVEQKYIIGNESMKQINQRKSFSSFEEMLS